MEKQKFYYGWLIKFILAAILLAAGILMKIYDVEVVYAATGIGIVIFSLVRVVPLMKSLHKEVLRTINLLEIIFDTIMGGIMIWVVFSGNSGQAFWRAIYGYLLVVFFYVRGLIYFISAHFFDEKSEGMKFWFHIFCITIAPALLVLTILRAADGADDIISTLGWLVLFISVVGGAYLGYDGYGGYRKYRESSKRLNEGKTIVKQSPPVEKEIPRPQAEASQEKELPAS
jgi:hypothetical protein